MDVIEPSRSISRVTSSMSVSNRTGTSNSNPARTMTPLSGAVVKVTTPVVVSRAQPDICSTVPSATRTVPATGLAMVLIEALFPELTMCALNFQAARMSLKGYEARVLLDA